MTNTTDRARAPSSPNVMRHKAFPNGDGGDDGWLVEAADDMTGECCSAHFTGPGAQVRAIQYAAWKNRTDLADAQGGVND